VWEGGKLQPRIYAQPCRRRRYPAISPKSIEPFLTHPLSSRKVAREGPRIIATEENRVKRRRGNVA